MRNTKMNNVVDDTLISLVSAELAHIGLIVPISEIETSAIKVYDNIQEAHRIDPNNKTINSYVKDDRYYNVLKFATCTEIVSRVRLTKTRNGYEVSSILAILQGYLDGLAEAAGTIRTEAPEVFSDILSKLPNVKVVFVQSNVGPQIVIGSGVETAKPPRRTVTGLNVCTNAIDRGTCDRCPACSCPDGEFESCGNFVSLSMMYKGMCYGIKLDPEAFGLTELAYKDDLPDKVNIMKNQIGAMARKLKSKAEEIFVGFYGAYHNQEDDEDE